MNSDVSRTAFLKAVSLCSDWQAHLDWFLQREQLYVLVRYQKVSSCNLLKPGVPGARFRERSTNDYTGYFLFVVMENVAECNLREEGLILLTAWEDTIMGEKEEWQVWEAAGHFVSVLKKQKVDRKWGLLKLTSVYPLPSVQLCLLSTTFGRAPIPKFKCSSI